MITLTLYLLSLLGIAVLGLFLYAKRLNKSATYFSAMSFFIAGWLAFQFLAIQIPRSAYALTIAGLVVYSFIAPLFLSFAIEFTNTKAKKLLKQIALLSLVVQVVISILPGTIKEVLIIDNAITVETNFAYDIQSYISVGLIFIALFLIIKNFKNFDQARKNSTFNHVVGITTAVAGNVLSGLVFADIASIQFIGPFSVFLMLALVSHSIVRHKLFDVRAIVARSVAYALILVILGGVYGLVVFQVIPLLFNTDQRGLGELLFLIVAALFMAFTFQPLRKKFDSVSNRLFYRDAYNSEEVLNEIGQLLASSIDLEKISRSTIQIIKDNLKVESATFIVLNKSEFDLLHEIGDLKREINLGTLAKVKQTIHFSDESSHTSLGGQLREDGIYAFIRLRTKKSLVGYLLLGQKSSGNIFNSQDARFLELASNELSIGLENAIQFEEIRQFNLTLQEKIKAATAELRDKNKKLHELDKAKDDFISMASHQLRTPLTTVKGYLSMVMEGDMGKINKEQKRVLNLSYASAQNMVFLITDLLNVSRLNTGKFVIEPNEFDLVEAIQLIVDQLARNAEIKELDLRFKHSMKSLPVYLDEGKLRQVIMNFTDNAIYYTPVGGKIEVSLEKSGESIEFKVKDNGIGVPKSEQHKLFQKFYRAENAKQTRPDGTGLGIFMAKKVVAVQGGAIIFHSEEGKGSTFGFSFPLKAIQQTAKKSKK